jgi:nucleoid DNA-binding protein
MKMTKKDIVEYIHKQMGLPKLLIKDIVNETLEIIKTHLQQGEEVKIVRFGKWQPVLRKAKRVKHPATGEMIQVPAYATVTFKASRELEKV